MTHAARLIAFLAAALLCAPASLSAQEVTLRIRDGRVTLNTFEVSPSAILARWAEIGGVTIVNGDKVSGPPLTLQLVDVDEREALAAVLRGVGGYILGERKTPSPTGSTIDRILILPASSRPAATAFNQPTGASPIRTEFVEPAATTVRQSPASPASPASSTGSRTEPEPNVLGASRVPTGAILPQQPRTVIFDGAVLDLVDADGNPLRAPTPLGTQVPVGAEPDPAQPLRPADRRTSDGPLGVTIGSTQPGTIAPNQDPRSTPSR